jgi:hypothetical protein
MQHVRLAVPGVQVFADFEDSAFAAISGPLQFGVRVPM